MGKQTKKSGSQFGGDWTLEKLEIIDKYLNFYIEALKKQIWARKVYIDAFAGSGKTDLPNGTILEGSPSIALKYDFAEYFFIEYDAKRISELKNYISTKFPEKLDKVHLIQGDCNTELPKIFTALSKNNNSRGVMFLDPYALELKWKTLVLSKQAHLDIWYLFPMMTNRLLQKNKRISDSFRQKLNTLLGNEDWEQKLYQESPQLNLFNEVEYTKEPVEELVKYIANKLRELFQYEPKMKLFKNSTSSPLFLLCFMITNPSPKAIGLSSKVASEIFAKIDDRKRISEEEA